VYWFEVNTMFQSGKKEGRDHRNRRGKNQQPAAKNQPPLEERKLPIEQTCLLSV
jgi:hypothetical protein